MLVFLMSYLIGIPKIKYILTDYQLYRQVHKKTLKKKKWGLGVLKD